MDAPFTFTPTVFNGSRDAVCGTIIYSTGLGNVAITNFLKTVTSGAIGLAPAYDSNCRLRILAIASLSAVIVIKFPTGKLNSQTRKKSFNDEYICVLEQFILCASIPKYAFQMDKVATALYLDQNMRITDAVDLLSTAKKDSRHSLEAIMTALGGELTLDRDAVISMFKYEENKETKLEITALQAWAACKAATLGSMEKRLSVLPRLNTQVQSKEELQVISATIRQADRLVSLKPLRTKNDVEKSVDVSVEGKLQLTSSRYKTKLRRMATHQSLEVEVIHQGKITKMSTRITKVDGRSAETVLNKSMAGMSIKSASTVGREAPTSAEAERSSIMLQSLQNTTTILSAPFVRKLWIPSKTSFWNTVPALASPVPIHYPNPRPLNRSQKKAVRTILSNKDTDRVVVVQGPPGTGKTTVIAATVTSIMASSDQSRTLWLVAQSNVAVKNIAEKLAKEDFWDFKILVSQDFHFDWHEHLYEKIQDNLIVSKKFTDDTVAMSRLLLGSRVILCTLSMLSNNKIAVFTQIVPLQTVIFDEASQIEVGDYFPMLSRYQATISKLVFIGDDKQLAPYGQSDITELRSIFEMQHLRKQAVFLDTQYRMPVVIGNFISKRVYGNRLKTIHKITSNDSCRFVDVEEGKEKRVGQSWVNQAEISTAIQIARYFNSVGHSYRIVTPYDPQRSQLELALKKAKLPWEDKCFNVDSFQGNEEDYIIISLVRSEKIGFLRERRRVNVMLTRCKVRMVICTSRAFVEQIASDSLVGLLAASLGEGTWINWRDTLQPGFTI